MPEMKLEHDQWFKNLTDAQVADMLLLRERFQGPLTARHDDEGDRKWREYLEAYRRCVELRKALAG